MNDQWSGKTLFNADRANPAAPSRVSSHRATRRLSTGAPSPVAVPVARSDRPGEVVGGDQVALVVSGERELRERSGSRSEDRAGAVVDVEGRLVAGTEEQPAL